MKERFRIIDAHVHCGRRDRHPPQDLGDYLNEAAGSGIVGAVLFAPVMEIYDRYDPEFEDDADWGASRGSANEYLLLLGGKDFEVFPYFFIWNDFAVEQLTGAHKGIKWHRHSDEPRYRYDDPRCAAAVAEIRRRNLPVVLEEEFRNTMEFIEKTAPGVRVVIPHLGLLNGGYECFRREGVWEHPNVYADTALASVGDIADYIGRYGHEKIFFGSDFPFGSPRSELNKIRRLGLPEEVFRSVAGSNIRRFLSSVSPI